MHTRQLQFFSGYGSLTPNSHIRITVSHNIPAGNLKFQHAEQDPDSGTSSERIMGGHHLILGQLTDFISGEVLDDTLDERHRQKIARLLVTQKGYLKSDITPRHNLAIRVGQKCAQLRISFTVTLKQHIVMLIHYGPGSMVTRHRPTLSMARLVKAYQVPLAVVTNGEHADILDVSTGKVVAAGLDMIPDRKKLMAICEKHSWETIEPQRREMEARILMAFEIDGRCPCDDSVCSIGPGQQR